jgi:hypothetical protein
MTRSTASRCRCLYADRRTAFRSISRRWVISEPYDARLPRLGQSPMIALASANLQHEVFPGLACLPPLSLSRSFRSHPGPGGHCQTGRWSPQSSSVRGSSAHPRPAAADPRRGLAKLAGMRRILLGGVAGVLLLAVGTRAADALGIGGPRLRCGCTETCWCKRPGLTVFRWVTPGRWHHIGLTAEEKRSRHSQA